MVATQYRFITQRPGKRGGQPYIGGVGVSVSTLVVMLNAGDSLDSIVAAYPGLTPEHVREVSAYYAENREKVDEEIALRSQPPAGYAPGKYGILKKK